jgi:aryl-alcohol dehydrogenase-like predicted oxidoreductase
MKESLKKLQLPYVDLIQVHDIEFSQSIDQIVQHTLPALKKLKEQGLARYIGITSYNLGVLKKVVQLSAPGTIDTILNYGRCNIMNQDLLDDVEFYRQRGIGVINASPLALGSSSCHSV